MSSPPAKYPHLPVADLDHILTHTADLWTALDGQRLFITGGTGFFGIWLLEALTSAQQQLGLGLQATVLSRHPDTFAQRFPHLAQHPALRWLTGDVQNFQFPTEPHSYVIHAATEAYARIPPTPALNQFATLVQGTQRVLEFAQHTGAQQVLLTSSGAVYGTLPAGLVHVAENYCGAPDCTRSATFYAEGKRCTEMLGALYAEQYGLPIKIARCFAFVGPHLPLDKHFAIGNFIHDVLRQRDVHIQGDGTPLRSYLHAADLVIWLLTILLRGQSMHPYNVGSDHAVISIAELAQRVIAASPASGSKVHIAQTPTPGAPPSAYVPDISRARTELGLQVHIPLDAAIQRTLAWLQSATAEDAT